MEHWIYSFNLFGYNVSLNLDTIFTMWFAMFVIIVFALIATKNISVIPNKLQSVSEALMNFFYGTLDTMIESENRRHVPLVASLFLFASSVVHTAVLQSQSVIGVGVGGV